MASGPGLALGCRSSLFGPFRHHLLWTPWLPPVISHNEWAPSAPFANSGKLSLQGLSDLPKVTHSQPRQPEVSTAKLSGQAMLFSTADYAAPRGRPGRCPSFIFYFFPISSPNSVPFGPLGNRLTFSMISSLPPLPTAKS